MTDGTVASHSFGHRHVPARVVCTHCGEEFPCWCHPHLRTSPAYEGRR